MPRPRSGLTKQQLKERLAAVLRDIMVDVDGKLERAIPYEHARQMTCDEVLSLFHFDHNIHHAIGGPDVHWNYTARLIRDHREKTATIDIPQIAKTKRIAAAHAAHVAKVTPTTAEDAESSPEKRIKPRRRMRSDGFTYDWKTRRYVKE